MAAVTAICAPFHDDAERHDRRARLPAGGAPRGDGMGELAGVAGVRRRRAVLQLLLPAARLHADDRGPAELGRARRVSSSPPSRPASCRNWPSGARRKPRRSGKKPGWRAAHNRSLLEASLDALVTIGADGRINDVNSAIEIADGPFASGAHRHGLLRLLRPSRRRPAPSIARCCAKGSCGTARSSSPPGRPRDLRALQRVAPSRRRRQGRSGWSRRPAPFRRPPRGGSLALSDAGVVRSLQPLRRVRQSPVGRGRAARSRRLDASASPS